ncbi:hypothetical protein QR680_011715 [Steinernema hermaphroditum]|uniref:Uncharacterized protein n=1 Tax=Steinernema hermaphroditum TaxID=289476 RepID=A0AA39I1Y4_9BILA|nr:hypothetical protein QR680_011715 [Steinernema hermaphroditum]
MSLRRPPRGRPSVAVVRFTKFAANNPVGIPVSPSTTCVVAVVAARDTKIAKRTTHSFSVASVIPFRPRR